MKPGDKVVFIGGSPRETVAALRTLTQNSTYTIQAVDEDAGIKFLTLKEFPMRDYNSEMFIGVISARKK